MPHSLRARLKNLQRKGELTEKDIDRIFNALEQDPCEDCEHNDGECCRILFERSFEQEPTDEWQNGYDRAWEEAEVFYEKEEPTIEAYRQVCKERDIAIEQLHELGYEFGQKIEPCDDVVSRQAIKKLKRHNLVEGQFVSLYDIEKLPSVRPQEQNENAISEDGTLTVHVVDGRKVSRVLVCGDNHWGGLYYLEEDTPVRPQESIPEQWQELKETIIEMRDNDGTCTQQEVCKFLVNLMDVLEKQMQEPKTGHWIYDDKCKEHGHCSNCDYGDVDLMDGKPHNYCPKCGARMVEPTCDTCKYNTATFMPCNACDNKSLFEPKESEEV